MLIHCPSCNTEYDCEPGKYECECGAKISVFADGTVSPCAPAQQDSAASQQNIILDIDKTIPPRQHGDAGSDIDATMPGKRDHKPDGRFDIGDLVLGRFKVLSELGQGGMGVVYECLDEVAGIKVALKALPPELSHNTQEMGDIKENFQLIHNLHHPNIAGYNTLERDQSNGNYYLIMECVEGEDLRHWIRRKRKEGPLTVEIILPVIRQVAVALDYAHEQKIIHRDIKPGNIMIDAVGRVKVLDFGLAAQIHTSMTRVSMAYHGTSGTAPYMAPEQWRGKAQGGAADQYALAVMTYEMLAGHLPFESTDASVLREAVLNEKVEPLQDIPVYAQEALARGLSKASSDRFKSCTDFTDAIGGISDAKQIRETKANISTKDNPASSKRHKERIAIIACAFAVITLVALILFFIFDGGKLRLNAITNGADALYKLGLAYENGEGVTKNYVEAVNCYTKAAEQGHAGAQNELGRCYDNGIGVKIDHAEAVKWYRMAADQDYAEAQLNLGRSYYYGNGIEMDMTEAMKWYQRSAENGDDKAQCYLGHYYEDIANYPEALKWYRMAAENGNSEAQFKTGFFLYRTEFSFIEKNYIEAVKWLRAAADQNYAEAKENLSIAELHLKAENGDAESQFELGNSYSYGFKNLKRSDVEAVKWYKKAAEKGYAKAQYSLAECYEQGTGIAKNQSEALKWYRKAADQEVAEAQYELGRHYEEGDGVSQDYAVSVKWYRKAAEQGNAKAQFKTGYYLYAERSSVPKDYAEAVKWLQKAAEQGDSQAKIELVNAELRMNAQNGDPNAQYELGKYYETEKKDSSEAAKWFRQAAEQGNAEAQYKLGLYFYDGNGIKDLIDEALKWLHKAANQGHRDAQYFLGNYYKEKNDYSESIKWFSKAAEQGHDEAKEALLPLAPMDISGGIANLILPNGISWKMIRVKAGTFETTGEEPHQAILTQDYYIGQTEVTQLQWKAVMKTNPSKYKGDNLPVENITWFDAIEFCKKLNTIGKAPEGWTFTLPTESQWEYAARGGNRSKGYKYSGGNNVSDVAWYYENSGDKRLNDMSWDSDKAADNHCKNHPVRQKKANELGLYDMSGNVWEFCCLDDWQDKIDRLANEFANRTLYPVLRGGSESDPARLCTPASWSSLPPSIKATNVGFRLALVQIK